MASVCVLPAIERVLKMYEPLKSYFLSIDKCPIVLQTIFEDPSSELWLMFLHNQSSMFHKTILAIEGDKNTIMEVSGQIFDLISKLEERLAADFISTPVKQILNNLTESGQIDKQRFMLHVKFFYKNSLQYLEKWTSQYKYAKDFQWACLKTAIKWEDVEKSFVFVSQKTDQTISENDLFDEVGYINKYIDDIKLSEWKEQNVSVDLRWVDIFQHFSTRGVPFKNILKLVEYILCLPGTNAVTERIFSLINEIWTVEKTQLSVETVKAILILKMQYKNCDNFL